MKKKPSRLLRLLSLNQHRKRWGARKFHRERPSFSELKKKTVEAGVPEQTRGNTKSIDEHMGKLRREFSTRTELEYYHAQLIVLLRREVSIDRNFSAFLELWESESEFLCEKLDLRWLVAAADTFSDHHSDQAVKAVAGIVSVLANVVKIYETENYLFDRDGSNLEARTLHLQKDLVPLFSGLSCFTVGTDDTLRNMRWRMDSLFSVGLVGTILRCVWDRLQIEETAFKRLRQMHARDKTAWW